MEETFELTIDEATLSAWGIPLDNAVDRADVIPVDETGFDEEAWSAQLVAELDTWAPGVAGVERILQLRVEMSRMMAEEQRELAELAAETRMGLPADAPVKDLEVAYRSLVAELAVANRVSDRTMAGRLAEAEMLVSEFPATLAALESGLIGIGHVRTIVEHGVTIRNAQARAQYEEAVIERAATVTPGRLRRFAELIAVRLGEVSFEDRHKKAREQRSVIMTELGDGMSQITHTLATALAEGVWDRLTQQAKAIKNAGDLRTFDQIRSDLAAELLLTGQPSGDQDAPHAAGVGIRAEVSVVIPVLTLLGMDDEPATIAGKGPIDLDTAKRLAADAPHLVRVLTHPVTGMVLSVDTYRPSEQLRRFLRIRDGRCRFPSCNRNARRCDIDHTVDRQFGGPTRADNLECLCRNHHTVKHHAPWRVRQTAPGVLEWTSPLGRVTIDLPDTGPRFAAA